MAISAAGIQGNILKPFARPHARYLFLQFTAAPRVVRTKFQSLLNRTVTSAEKQAEVTAAWIATGRRSSPQTVGMFGVSHRGLTKLERIVDVPISDATGSTHFSAGMEQQHSVMWDPQAGLWQAGYRGSQLDAFLLLCDDDRSRLDGTVTAAKAELAGFARLVVEETGAAISDASGNFGLEPFGFRDGVSDLPDPESVFVAEPTGTGFGTYGVFAKFEQHVDKFRAAAQAVETKAAASGVVLSADRAGELAVGRHRDGTPLVPHGVDGINDFNFSGVSASTCPFHAHIRAVNPRNGLHAFRMIRRGIPYPAQGGSDPGLLFLSIQSSLMEFLGMFLRSRKQFDPILARSSQLTWVEPSAMCDGGSNPGQRWPAGGREICHPMLDLTTLRGGEYFYIPSMNFISRLA